MDKNYGGYELKSDMLLRNVENFTRYDWVKNQSFCWKDNKKFKFIERLGETGLCFVLNGNENLLRSERSVEIATLQFIISIIELFAKINF